MANPSRAIASKKSRFLRGNGLTPETFTYVGEIMDLNGPDGSVGLTEVTTLESTGKEYIAEIPDFGEVVLTLNFDEGDAQQRALEDDYYAQLRRNFQVILSSPLSKTFSFAGFVTKYGYNTTVNKQITCNITVKITGPVLRS